MNTIEIRKQNAELVKRIMQSIKNIRLWTDTQFEGDMSVRSSVYKSSMIKCPKTKGRFLSKFLFQSLADDIEELQSVLDPGRLEEFQEQNFLSAEALKRILVKSETKEN